MPRQAYCILIAGPPASGKSTLAAFLSQALELPMVSKDSIKEILFDDVGFTCRAEKVRLGTASMNIMYYFAERLMALHLPFILENNFENVSRSALRQLLDRWGYTPLTIRISCDPLVLYRRFCDRETSPARHRGHVVNSRFPENPADPETIHVPAFEQFIRGNADRGMDSFDIGGPLIIVDTTAFDTLDMDAVAKSVRVKIAALDGQSGSSPL